MNFMEFVNSKERNIYIEDCDLSIYIRRGNKYVHNADFELANIVSYYPSQGNLIRFLDLYEQKYTFFVESILEEKLIPFLEKRGYILVPNTNPPCCISKNCNHIFMDYRKEEFSSFKL